MKAALLVLLCAGPAGAQSFGSFAEARVRTLDDGEDKAGRLSLPLTLVILDGSNWSEKRVLGHLERTRSIFKACGVAVGPVTLVHAKPPGGRHDLDMTDMHPEAQVPQDVLRIAGLLPRETRWPVAFFAGRLRGDSALARSYGRGEVEPGREPDFPYMNTAWFAFKTHWIERRDQDYSSLAHELTHLLCECGHERRKEPHMMHTHRNMLSARILPEHCALIVSSPLLEARENTTK